MCIARLLGFPRFRPQDRPPRLEHAEIAIQTEASISVPNVREEGTQVDLVNEELIARRWLKANGFYWAKEDSLANHFYHHFLSVMRMPRGSADRAGSQQCAFSMPMPSNMAAFKLMANAPCKGKVKYTINAAGQIEWKSSPSITTWYIDDQRKFTKWLAMHRRGLGQDMYGATKMVPPTGGYWESNVTVQLIVPFIAELCERSHDRLVMEVTCNSMTYNDHGIMKLPPNFAYTSEQAATFLSAVRFSTKELAYRNVAKAPLSQRFRQLVGADGEESSGVESDPE